MRKIPFVLLIPLLILTLSCTNSKRNDFCDCNEVDSKNDNEIIEELNLLFTETDNLVFGLKNDTLTIETRWTFVVRLSDLNIEKGYTKEVDKGERYISVPTRSDSDVVLIKFGNGQVINEDHISFDIIESKFPKFQKLFCKLLCDID